MKKIIGMFLMLCCFWNLGAFGQEKLRIVTENLPPLQMQVEGQLGGLATEVVQATLREAKLSGEIEVLPWARAYQIASEEKDVLIYSIGRSKERENLFKWIGVIKVNVPYVWKLKKRSDIQVNSLEDCKPYQIGVVNQDNRHRYLLEHGFKNDQQLRVLYSYDQIIKMLFAERVDLFIFDETLLVHQLKVTPHLLSEMEKVFFIPDGITELYLAINQQSSQALADRLTEALESVKMSGEFDRIRSKYLQI